MTESSTETNHSKWFKLGHMACYVLLSHYMLFLVLDLSCL